MKTYRLTREHFVPLDIETVFEFFADARNLERLTPPWLHFRIVSAGVFDLEVGSLIDYRLSLHGVPIRWQSEITCWQPPYRFIDEQRRGPYQRWAHTHSFTPVAGHTIVSDDVEYAVPGPAFVEKLFVRPDLERIFDYRGGQLDAWIAERSGRREGAAAGT